MIPTKINLSIVWKSDTIRIVVWYEPIPILPKLGEPSTIFRRKYVIEQVLTKDVLGEPNWQRIQVTDGVSTIIESFLDKLKIVKDKMPE